MALSPKKGKDLQPFPFNPSRSPASPGSRLSSERFKFRYFSLLPSRRVFFSVAFGLLATILRKISQGYFSVATILRNCLVSRAMTPDSPIKAIKLGMAIKPFAISAKAHTVFICKIDPGMIISVKIKR